MKFLWLFLFCFLCNSAVAQQMTVTDVTVSVTDVSAAMAREKAIEEAHSRAFQKLLQENFPEAPHSVPPSEILMNMVTNFSIDREKTTLKSYTASLTFEFNGPQVHVWLQGKVPLLEEGLYSPSHEGHQPLKIIATYANLAEWARIKNSLESLPGVTKVAILSLSLQTADVEVFYQGRGETLQALLSQQGFLVTPEQGTWLLTTQTSAFP